MAEVARLTAELEDEHHRRGWDQEPTTLYVLGRPPGWKRLRASRVSSFNAMPGDDSVGEQLLQFADILSSKLGRERFGEFYPDEPVGHVLIFEVWIGAAEYEGVPRRVADVPGSREAREAIAVVGDRQLTLTRERGGQASRVEVSAPGERRYGGATPRGLHLVQRGARTMFLAEPPAPPPEVTAVACLDDDEREIARIMVEVEDAVQRDRAWTHADRLVLYRFERRAAERLSAGMAEVPGVSGSYVECVHVRTFTAATHDERVGELDEYLVGLESGRTAREVVGEHPDPPIGHAVMAHVLFGAEQIEQHRVSTFSAAGDEGVDVRVFVGAPADERTRLDVIRVRGERAEFVAANTRESEVHRVGMLDSYARRIQDAATAAHRQHGPPEAPAQPPPSPESPGSTEVRVVRGVQHLTDAGTDLYEAMKALAELNRRHAGYGWGDFPYLLHRLVRDPGTGAPKPVLVWGGETRFDPGTPLSAHLEQHADLLESQDKQVVGRYDDGAETVAMVFIGEPALSGMDRAAFSGRVPAERVELPERTRIGIAVVGGQQVELCHVEGAVPELRCSAVGERMLGGRVVRALERSLDAARRRSGHAPPRPPGEQLRVSSTARFGGAVLEHGVVSTIRRLRAHPVWTAGPDCELWAMLGTDLRQPNQDGSTSTELRFEQVRAFDGTEQTVAAQLARYAGWLRTPDGHRERAETYAAQPIAHLLAVRTTMTRAELAEWGDTVFRPEEHETVDVRVITAVVEDGTEAYELLYVRGAYRPDMRTLTPATPGPVPALRPYRAGLLEVQLAAQRMHRARPPEPGASAQSDPE